MIERYQLRIILADHSPQGKHKGLKAALEAGTKTDTQWVLGVRGVKGRLTK